MTQSSLGLSTISGLPAHVLIVHLVVVFVPLSAGFLVASLHPRAARRIGRWLPITAAIALLSVFAAMNAGGWLQAHVANTALVQRHADLGGQLWPFSTIVLVLSLVVWGYGRRGPHAQTTSNSRDAGQVARTVTIGLLAVVAAALSIVQVVRIGDSGARAAWHDSFSTTAHGN